MIMPLSSNAHVTNFLVNYHESVTRAFENSVGEMLH